MNIRSILTWLGLSAMTAALGAGPPTPAQPARAAAASPRLPVARPRARIGAAPKAEFQVGNHAYKIEPKQASVALVRNMAPKSYEPAVRSQSVSSFYHEQFAKDAPPKDKLANLYVGPFRREFIWWALRRWEMSDRAWWAWNNYAYFDHDLWLQWMADSEFAKLIAQYDASHQPRVLGFVPAQYATNAAEVIYNDEYIDAVYNPEPTLPSIVVDSSAGGRLSNLIEGVPRVFGRKSFTIGTLADRVKRYQFVSLPAGFDPTYQIEVKRDGELYIFGPKSTPREEAFGTDAAKWVAVTNLVNGQGIEVVYQRQVKAGDKIHLHGVEWSLASEQIELFSPATPEAVTAWRYLVKDLQKMSDSKGDFVQANLSLNDYVQEAHDAAAQLITTNNNVNEDVVADCHYELAHLRKMSETVLAQTSDKDLAKAGKAFVSRVKSLEDNLNEVDELRDPGAPVAEAPAAEPVWTNLLDPAQLGGWSNGNSKVGATFQLGPDGTVAVHNTSFIWGASLRDAVIRATVRKVNGRHSSLNLRRRTGSGVYTAWFNGGDSFGIGVTVKGRYHDLGTVHTAQKFPGFFTMQFSAVGNQLVLSADGQEILRVVNDELQAGSVGISDLGGESQFKDVQIQVLDQGAPVASGEPKIEEQIAPQQSDASSSLWDWKNPDNGVMGTLNLNADGSCVTIRCMNENASELASHWKQVGDTIQIDGTSTVWKSLPNGQMVRVDSGVTSKVLATKRAWGDLGETRLKVISATFGSGPQSDVSQRVMDLFDKHQDVLINPAVLEADPNHGKVKSLSIEYTVDGQKKSAVVAEKKLLRWRDLVGNAATGETP